MDIKEFEVKFHFGAKKIKKRNVFITALLLNLAVDILTRILRLKPLQLWALIDEIGRHFKIALINELILQSPELLENRIERDVDKAVLMYNREVHGQDTTPDPEIPEPTRIDEKDGETPLGGPLGFTYTFTEDEENEQR
jgi:hypothetical protein